MSTEQLVKVQVTEGSPAVLGVSGELDLATVPELDDLLSALADRDLVVDLADVTFMGTSGITSLLTALRRSRDGGHSFALRSPSAPVSRVLRLTGVDQMFTIEA